MSRSLPGKRFASIVSAVALWIACAPPAAAQNPVPIGYWAFDACTGVDSSANAKNLTVNGGVCGPGRFGNAFTLNGSSDYLEFAPDPVFTPAGGPWSVVAWVKTTTIDPGFLVAVGWYRCGANPGCTASDADLYTLGMDHLHGYWEIRDDAGNEADLEDSTNIADGNWHLLVGTNNPGIHPPRLYVDGVLKTESVNGVSTIVTGSVLIPFEVGRLYRTGWGSPGNYFPGSIDEVRLYNVELTPGQVAKLYTDNTTPTNPTTWGAIKSRYR